MYYLLKTEALEHNIISWWIRIILNAEAHTHS